jgi:TPR repeat protein
VLQHHRRICFIPSVSCRRVEKPRAILGLGFRVAAIFAVILFCKPVEAQNGARSEKELIQQAEASYKARSYAEAAALFAKAADQGDAKAQYEIGRMYVAGVGVEKNCETGAAWLLKSANQSFAQAQTALGVMYRFGYSCVPRAAAAARTWLERAADQGEAFAQIWLGEMYLRGEGGKPDFGKALSWLQKGIATPQQPLADPGGEEASMRKFKAIRAEALYEIGTIYEQGLGVPKNSEEAKAWYIKAAEQGYADARVKLAQLQGSPGAQSETINLTCHNVRGDTAIAINPAAKSVRIEGASVVEYRDGGKQYVTITDDFIDFGCRVQRDASDVALDIGADVFEHNKSAEEIPEAIMCLTRNRIDRRTGVWMASSSGITGNHADSAQCSVVPAKRQF